MSTPPPADRPRPTAPSGAAPAADAGAVPRRALRIRRRSTADRARAAAEAAAPETPPPPAFGVDREVLLRPPEPTARPGGLRRRRRHLLRHRQEAIYHLGGLAFELYRRELLEEDVMRRGAAEIAALDETVRLIDARLQQAAIDAGAPDAAPPAADAPIGSCLTCRATFRTGARFCANCGTALLPLAVPGEEVTEVISAPPAGGHP